MRKRHASRSVRIGVRAYRLGARLLPDEFRAEYGDPLEECFGRIAADARAQRGRLAVAGVTVRAIIDVMTRAPQAHLAAARAGVLGAGGGWGGWWQDVRHAVRRLRRQPGFTAASVLTLGLGVGAAASVFSLVHGVLLSPLPYPDADRIAQVDHAAPGFGVSRRLGVTYGFYRFYAEHLRSVESVAMYSWVGQTLTGAGEPVRLSGIRATPSLVDVLRVAPRHGRWFAPRDALPGAPLTVVLSHSLWQRAFGGDFNMIGRTIDLDDVPSEVIGIMPASFAFPDEDAAFWIARAVPATGIGGWNEEAIARLAPSADAATLEREMAALLPLLRESNDDPARVQSYLDDARITPRVVTLKENVVGDVRSTLWLLMGTVGVVLLIALANVANLFLVQVEEGQRERAVRAALGADRLRIARGHLIETLVVSLAGSAIGVAIAAAAVAVLRATAPVNVPRLNEVAVTPTVLGVVLATSVVAAILLGLVPALRGPGDPGAALMATSRRTTGGRVARQSRNVLMAAQVALALVLLIGSGLLLRTFTELRAIDLGFSERDALVFDMGLPESRYRTNAEAVAFHVQLQERLAGLSGVENVAAIGQCLPLAGNMCWGETLEAEGRSMAQGAVPPVTGARVATPGYFRTLGIAVRGRTLTPADSRGPARVAILSEATAAAYFGSEDPIGRRVRFDADDPWHLVVGVAANVRGRVEPGAGADLERVIYLPMSPEATAGPPPHRVSYVITTAQNPTVLAPAVRRAVAELDPTIPLADVRTLQQTIDRATAPTAFSLTLIALAAAIALVLGVVGVYAVIAYAVSRRTAEIGVRMALGARAADVRAMVLRQGGAVILVGVAIGLAGALALTRFMRGMLHGVSPTDPASYAVLTCVMIAVAALALWLPARRASRVDPLEALRSD